MKKQKVGEVEGVDKKVEQEVEVYEVKGGGEVDKEVEVDGLDEVRVGEVD